MALPGYLLTINTKSGCGCEIGPWERGLRDLLKRQQTVASLNVTVKIVLATVARSVEVMISAIQCERFNIMR
jgi:hypothetical protein